MFEKLKEYLDLIPKAVPNADKIVKGIINNVRFNQGELPEEEQDEIIKRRVICTGCPFNSSNANKEPDYKNLHNGQVYTTERTDLHCSLCACNIHWKTAVLEEECGLQYYNDTNPDNIQELKWNKFKKNQTNV